VDIDPEEACVVKRLLLLATVCYLLVPAAVASAHPLGNFTINRFARVEIAGDRLYVRYVVDMAEIPTLQRVPIRIAALHISIDGRPVQLTVVRTALAHPRGAAGLHTTRFQAILEGPRVTHRAAIAVDDRNYAARIGWKEIIFGSRTRSASNELQAYPNDLLSSPLDVSRASALLQPTNDRQPMLLTGKALAAPDRIADSGFASLVGRDHLGTGVILLSLLLALFWGAAHAFSPGHGKAIVAGYLVGTRGNARHAALLGLIVTVTHTIGVFALGLVTLALSQFIVPDTLYPWLNLASALLVVAVGLATLRSRYREWAHTRAHAREAHHDHHHHGHEHGHSHAPEPGTGMRGLVSVGISGGILPCPSALVVLLAAIALHRVGYGLLLIVAFSVGLAASVTGIGLVAVTAKRAFARMSLDGRVIRALPALSAVFVLVLGVAMTVRALPHLI
jgi:ABC-type nickel/cobalt efflux system permease component RcnA